MGANIMRKKKDRFNWSDDDKLTLVNYVLEALRSGDPIAKGIRRASEALNIEKGKCTSMWYFLRSNYTEAIEISKQTRTIPEDTEPTLFDVENDREVGLQMSKEVILEKAGQFSNVALGGFLDMLKILNSEAITLVEQTVDSLSLQQRINILEKELKEERAKTKKLESKLLLASERYNELSNDHSYLLKLMGKARAMIEDEKSTKSKKRFRMDVNGNLETIKP